MRYNKILSIFSAILCALPCISAPVSAEKKSDNILEILEEEYGSEHYKNINTATNGMEYIVRSGNAIIVGMDKSKLSSDLVVPAEIDGFPVIAIDDNAFSCLYLSGVNMIKSITLPDTIISIGDYAFSNSRLTEITIPESVKYIGVGINAHSYNISEIKVSEKNPYFTAKEGVLYSKDMKTLVEFPCGKKDSVYTIPEGVTEIYGGAFYNCENLENINIPDSVNKIGREAFFYCYALENIVIPEGVTEINKKTFFDCSALTKAELPDTLKFIDDKAFFNCEKLKEINIPDSVEYVGYNAFNMCKSLESIEFPDNADINGTALYRCESLVNVKLPENITEIPGGLCDGCTSLENITIPEGVKFINGSAFAGCSLKSIVIPDSVESIGISAFSMNSLENIIIPEGHIFKYIGENAFGRNEYRYHSYGTSLASAPKWYENQPDEYIYIGNTFYDYNGKIEEGETIKLREGTVTIASGAFINQKKLTDISLPDSLLYINDKVFFGCRDLESIDLPENLESIGDEAFIKCGIKEITLPASVKKIYGCAFSGCNSLEKFTVLDPNCSLCESKHYPTGIHYSPISMLPETTALCGYTGSTAEVYAKMYGRKFIPIDAENTTDVTPSETPEKNLTLAELLKMPDKEFFKLKNANKFYNEIKKDAEYEEINSIESIRGGISGTVFVNINLTDIDKPYIANVTESEIQRLLGDTVKYELHSPIYTEYFPDIHLYDRLMYVTSKDYIIESNDDKKPDISDGAIVKMAKFCYCIDQVINITYRPTTKFINHWISSDIIIGDVNFDKIIDMNDAVCMNKGLTGKYKFTEFQTAMGDINKDGKFDILDSITVKQMFAPETEQSQLTDAIEKIKQSKTTLPGDISGNGKIDLHDVIIIAEALAGKRNLSYTENLIADNNMNGTVELHDAIELAGLLIK